MAAKLPNPPHTVNGEYFDATLRHQIGLRALTTSEVKRLSAIMEKADRELTAKLRTHLANIAGKPVNFSTVRMKRLLKVIRDIRTDLVGQLRMELKEDLIKLAKLEAEFEVKMVKDSLPVDINIASVPAETLRALVTTLPFSGGPDASRTLNQWFTSLKVADQARIIEAVQLGVSQGETVDQMVRRIVGTRAAKYSDGILATSRRNAEAIVRTGVNHISNAAREQVWMQNSDIIAGLKWVSTLDGRTTAICRSRDGQVAPLPGHEDNFPLDVKRLDPPTARPPAHPNCRSVVVSVIDGEGLAGTLGERPFVRDMSTGKNRQIDFRDRAKAKAGAKWSGMSAQDRNSLIRSERSAWSKRVVGRVPNDVTYNEWLKRQPSQFQDDVLGKTKGKLFRDGNLTMDKFVDRAGHELTLEELAKTNPSAFIKAGLDPSEF